MRVLLVAFCCVVFFVPQYALAQVSVATTTLNISVCGNSVTDSNEECDFPGQTGVYSQTIDGKQCTAACVYGPYCGDGILQASFTEECDDGNNDSGDFCSALCKIEPAGSGGGGSSGGGSGGSGGSDVDLGDTLVAINGFAYPSQTVNVLLDGRSVGTVRSDNDGGFEITVESSPGTATLGLWSTDVFGTQSITFNNTFDVTQGAITNVNGVVLPPTIRVSDQTVDPGDIVTFSGQATPGATLRLYIDDNTSPTTATVGADGRWSIDIDTGTLQIAEHIFRAKAVTGSGSLTTESGFSTSLQLFVGVDGQVTRPSDLNRDGFVNLIDFSILIFWWQTDGGESDPPADINQNGRVSLEDFSILLFNWTG